MADSVITAAHIAAPFTSAWLGHLVVLGGPGWTHYATTAWRTVLLHYRVLVAWAKHRRAEKQEFDASPLAHPETLTWDPGTLGGFHPVRVPDQTAAESVQSGRHSKGAVA